jgi:hypothetical protein
MILYADEAWGNLLLMGCEGWWWWWWVVVSLQLHCLQYLIHELVSGGAPKKVGGFFSAVDSEIPSGNLRQFENFFNRLAFFPHILDYRGKYLKPLHFSKLDLGGPAENSCLITVNHHQRRISTGIIRELF